MNVEIRRVDKDIPVPEYKTPGSAAMDCYARVTTTVPGRGVAYVPLNFSLQPPPGHFVLMAARSSLHKRGVVLANGIGVFDEDFSGNDDEYTAILHNITDAPVTIERGDRITQIIVLPFDRATFTEVEDMKTPSRSGIGSTGIK